MSCNITKPDPDTTDELADQILEPEELRIFRRMRAAGIRFYRDQFMELFFHGRRKGVTTTEIFRIVRDILGEESFDDRFYEVVDHRPSTKSNEQMAQTLLSVLSRFEEITARRVRGGIRVTKTQCRILSTEPH